MRKKTPDKRLLSIQAKNGGQTCLLLLHVAIVNICVSLHAFSRLNGRQSGLYSYEICSWRNKLC